MQGRLENMTAAWASSRDCHVAACHAPMGVGPLADSELERLESRVDARLRRLVIADRLRAIWTWVAIVTGAIMLVVVLV